jgi:predicted small lipoprotein YifL
MRRTAAIAIALMSLVALSDCGRKPQVQQPQAQKQQSETAPPAPQPQAPSSGGGLFSASCPQPPSRAQVEAALKSAMNQIYGADETGARITVVSMTPAADCKTQSVTYKTSGTQATAPMSYGDDGKWSVTLYKKTYPVP